MTLSSTLAPPTHRDRTSVQLTHRSLRMPTRPEVEVEVEEGVTSTACWERSAGLESAMLSDEDLIGRYRDLRGPEDFSELVRRHSGELGRYLGRYLGNAALAEDVLQDTFLQVHAKCGLYRDGCPARPWLYAIAIHRAVDALRRSRRLPAIRLDPSHSGEEAVDAGSLIELLASADPGPLEKLQDRERQRWVRERVAQLAEPLRQVLVLAYYQGLTYAEIARLLELPLGTVKSRMHGAIARLRGMAERYDRAGGR